MNLLRYLLPIIFLLLTASNLLAQFLGDSLIYSEKHYKSNFINSSYEKQLNTHSFRSNLEYGRNINQLFLGINQVFNSSVIRGSTKNIRDEQKLAIIGIYNFSDLFQSGINFIRNDYADDRSLAINNSSINNVTLFSNYLPSNKIRITPFLGFSDNKQVGIDDNGLLYGLEAILNNYKTDEFIINSEANYSEENIDPRKNISGKFKITLENKFENNLTNTIKGLYIEQRKDFYFETDSLTKTTFDVTKNIQSRTERHYSISDIISYNPDKSNWLFSFEGKASWRNIDRNTKYKLSEQGSSSLFDTKIEEFNLDFAGNIAYNSRFISTFLKLVFTEREEKNNAKFFEGASESAFTIRQESEAKKNNRAQQTTVSAGMNYNLSKNDILTFSLFHRKLVYNTPSDQNFDDRDELLSIAGLTYNKRLSPYFNLFATLEGSLNKIVYILSERSSNNNIQRTIKLVSGGSYKSSGFNTSNQFEVSANYTAYDFEDLNPNFRSFAFRQFVFKDSSRVKIVKNVGASLSGYVKLSEQSDFIWDEFKGRPVRFLEEIFAEPKLEYYYRGITFGLGLRYFSLSSFKYDVNSERVADTKYTSYGPLSTISYFIGRSVFIKCTGWYEFINNESNNKRELANLFIDVRWNI